MESKDVLEDFRKEVDYLMGCCLKHPLPEPIRTSNIVDVEMWVQSVPDEKTGYALFRMADGQWGTLIESQDYTGHG